LIVLDNSVFIAALFEDEHRVFATQLYRLIMEGEEDVIVPAIFLYEACNVIMNSRRRQRISAKEAQKYLDIIYEFPIGIDSGQEIQHVVNLAEKHGLSTYDASYLEICKREKLPLATLDKALAAAAKREKVVLVTTKALE